MHESSGNADSRVFGFPRMKRDAPDLRVTRAGWDGWWSRETTRRPISLQMQSFPLVTTTVEQKGVFWAYMWMDFVVFAWHREQGNMAGTND